VIPTKSQSQSDLFQGEEENKEQHATQWCNWCN
jgi:hypothetical protein